MRILKQFSSNTSKTPEKMSEHEEITSTSISKPGPSSSPQGITAPISSSSSSLPPQEFTTPLLTNTKPLDSGPEDFLVLLDRIATKHPNLLRRYDPGAAPTNHLSKSEPKPNTKSKPTPSSSSPSLKYDDVKQEDDDDRESVITSASWITDAYDDQFHSSLPSSVLTDGDVDREGDEDLLFRGEPKFIFPTPEGLRAVFEFLADSGLLDPNGKLETEERSSVLERGKEGGEDIEASEESEGNEEGDEKLVILENEDRVGLAAFATVFMFGGLWVLENKYF